MPYCPNPDCPHRISLDEPAEFNKGVATCSDCGSALSEAAPKFEPLRITKAKTSVAGWSCPECGSVNTKDISLCACGYDSNRPFVITTKKDKEPAADTAVQPGKPLYAGFWLRFGALWLDLIIFSPIIGLTLWLSQNFRLFYIYYFVPSLFIGFMYSIYLVRRYGGTPGKLLMGLRITCIDGSPIGYREAILRHAPEFVLGTFSSLAIILASLNMTDSEYLSLSMTIKFKTLREHSPPWHKVVETTQSIWTWGEFIVLLTNRKRRALHDFIAGTVVVKRYSKSKATNL